MKKKIAMRVASLALCVVFTGLLFGAPKAKAMGLEVATGSLAVATYLSATGAPLIVTPGASANLVATGISSMASSYVGATGVASSGSAWLSSLAAGVSISPAGALVLTAAAVVAIGALVAWYVNEKGLDDTGTSVVLSDYSYVINGETFCFPIYESSDQSLDESMRFYRDVTYQIDNGYSFCWSGRYIRFYNSSGSSCGSLILDSYDFFQIRIIEDSNRLMFCSYRDVWDVGYISNSSNTALVSVIPQWFGAASEVSVLRTPEFTQLDIEFEPESQKQMVIDAGFPAGTTLDTVAEQVPELIAAGTLAPTYEITTTDTGEDTGNGTETQPDEETGIYIPVLSDIKTRLSTLGDTIVDGIMDGLASLFVPSETYLEALPEQITDTFEERTGFLTYPFSLLPDFVDRLSESSGDWILRWPQIVEPFTNTVLFQQGSFNVSSFIRSNGELGKLYELYRLLAKVFMSFGFLGLCYNKYRSVVGDDYGGL